MQPDDHGSAASKQERHGARGIGQRDKRSSGAGRTRVDSSVALKSACGLQFFVMFMHVYTGWSMAQILSGLQMRFSYDQVSKARS